jgi:hypothetical protein
LVEDELALAELSAMSAVETVNLSEGEKNGFTGSCLERHLKSLGLDSAHESNAVICFGFVRERGDREMYGEGLHALFKRFSCQYIKPMPSISAFTLRSFPSSLVPKHFTVGQ